MYFAMVAGRFICGGQVMNSPCEPVYISLGSNMGDAEQNLQDALDSIRNLPDADIVRISTVYKTEPQGVADQPWFANQVAMLRCGPSWSPQSFVKALLTIEDTLGRVRVERWGPRIIDLDLLLFGNQQVCERDTMVPHPRMGERAFVLVPLYEIAPELCLPSGEPLEDKLAQTGYACAHNRIWQHGNN